MIRILIADDHDVVRSGLRRLLEAQPGWEVVAEATEGLTNRQVAKVLGVSRKTVENGRTAIMRRLNLPSAAALVLYAIRNGVIEP
jgi:DNA-binding NarL/FixJ family response regulator